MTPLWSIDRELVSNGSLRFPLQSFLDLRFTIGEIEEQVYLGGRDCPVFNLTDCQLQVCFVPPLERLPRSQLFMDHFAGSP